MGWHIHQAFIVAYHAGPNVRKVPAPVDHKPKPTEDSDPQGEFLRPPSEAKRSRWGLRGKTFWDWLQLLIVPLVLVLITIAFTWYQTLRQEEFENQRVEEARALEDRRAAAERTLQQQNAQDEALRAYLDQMSNLLLEHNLRNPEDVSGVRTLARARTLTVLRALDPSRKAAVIQFLAEADLVQGAEGRQPIVRLNEADLSGVSLLRVNLSGADLSNAELSGAVLERSRSGVELP